MKKLLTLIGVILVASTAFEGEAYERVYDPYMYFMSQGKEVKVKFLTTNRGTEARTMSLQASCNQECSSSWFTRRLLEDFVKASQTNAFYTRYYIEQEPCSNPWDGCIPHKAPIELENSVQEGPEEQVDINASGTRRYYTTTPNNRDKNFADQIVDGAASAIGSTVGSAVAGSIITLTGNPSSSIPSIVILGEKKGSRGQVVPTVACKFNGTYCAPYDAYQFVYDSSLGGTLTVHYDVDKSSEKSRQQEFDMETLLSKMSWMCTTTYTGTLPRLTAQKTCYAK
ncbi:hypothetical protein C3B51_21725 [Pseudoalteromonas rubra]|uniref:Secreted protein n=1 Tax=Pseudoalteromonas rubra TaxID=43658 RepID=A0A4Q7DXN2_9GAMM|nr:hypothetical protein [Pseudoalteromonas rubra]RZM72477.1 hypothetical protein C3B51_21725 [Pseudoalteromonas rubra]